jgi:hypothetical protein
MGGNMVEEEDRDPNNLNQHLQVSEILQIPCSSSSSSSSSSARRYSLGWALAS